MVEVVPVSPRVERIGNAELWLGDCREILPSLTADHVISDPPYEDELHTAVGRIRRNDGREMIQSLGFEGINSSRAEVASLVVQASRGWAILFTLAEGVRAWRDDIQTAGGKWDTCLAWIKPDAAPRFNGQGAARGFECAVTAWCGKGYRSWNGGGKRGIYTALVNGERDRVHPTQKPLSLMQAIIGDYTQPGNVVLDPFMGSGTTGDACVRMGRKFIGVERDSKWFEFALRRIEQAYRQADLFVSRPPEPKAETGDMFA